MHWLGLVWLFNKLFYAVNFVLYRIASWSGALYLYRRGRRRKKRRYYLYAALVYIASWGLLLLGYSESWRWLSTFFHRR